MDTERKGEGTKKGKKIGRKEKTNNYKKGKRK